MRCEESEIGWARVAGERCWSNNAGATGIVVHEMTMADGASRVNDAAGDEGIRLHSG